VLLRVVKLNAFKALGAAGRPDRTVDIIPVRPACCGSAIRRSIILSLLLHLYEQWKGDRYERCGASCHWVWWRWLTASAQRRLLRMPVCSAESPESALSSELFLTALAAGAPLLRGAGWRRRNARRECSRVPKRHSAFRRARLSLHSPTHPRCGCGGIAGAVGRDVSALISNDATVSPFVK
jgi:hypothetical protein